MKKISVVAVCLFVYWLLLSAGLAAQQAGVIAGSVTNPVGGREPGATVTLTPEAAGATPLQATTDGSGYFSFSGLAPGTYRLEVTRQGFEANTRSITLGAGAHLDVSVPLLLATSSQVVTAQATGALTPTEAPMGETITTVSPEDFENTPAFSVIDIFNLSPGVTTSQGNGPRDVSVSIRGSNAQQTYGVRNIQVFEDGFPVTQPDGLARTDLSDPHSYGDVNVIEGPSSALYGNYATGGAVNFHTRQTAGLELGADYGSFGYNNDYLNYGTYGTNYGISVNASDTLGNLYTDHTQYNTFTTDVLATYSLNAHNRLTFKFIDNELSTDLSIRLSLNQYLVNPWQKGCAALAAAGCASVSVYANGFNGTKVALSADEAGLQRNDRRTIVGARWDHDLNANTTWSSQLVWDDRDINQPTSATSAIGPYPSFNASSSLQHTGTLWGDQTSSWVEAAWNYENEKSLTYDLMPGGNATLGGLTQTVLGSVWNGGVRAHEQISLNRRLTLSLAAGLEHTTLNAYEDSYTYPTGASPTIANIPVLREYLNFAPDVALQFQARHDLAFRAHVGTGYGTPQITNLFTTPQGVPGNNTQLRSQTNTGVDLGTDWTPGPAVTLSVTGFGEWFHNEFVTQSPGVSLLSYTFNAPASLHRGVQGLLDVRPIYSRNPGLRFRVSYLLDRQTYSDFYETLSAGLFSSTFDRDGNLIPGVVPNNGDARLMYDQTHGSLRGVGGFIEANYRQSFVLDNANLLRAPQATVWDANVHFSPYTAHGVLSRLNFYLEVRNLSNRAYVASASNVSDSLSSSTGMENGLGTLAGSGSIWAGEPRNYVGGIEIHVGREK